MAEKDGSFFKAEEKLTAGQSFRLFLWNPRTKEFCGRTGISWVKILVFYIIFYACLAAFWAVMLLIFYQTIDERQPKWTLDDSRIGSNPGLGFRPRPPPEKVESTLIWFSRGEGGKYEHWVKDLSDFIGPYSTQSSGAGEHAIGDCEQSSSSTQDSSKYCLFDVRRISDNCTKENQFGFKYGAPCVLIKLNRIYGWKPVPFGPDDAPSDLKKLVGHVDSKKVYITCEGENPADKENIGPVEYSPSQGIDSFYFPFTNQPGYLSPFVFVHFLKPASGVLINIECKAWAKNIKHDRMDREGSVHFELLID